MTFEGSLGWSGGRDEEEDFLHERNCGQEVVGFLKTGLDIQSSAQLDVFVTFDR